MQPFLYLLLIGSFISTSLSAQTKDKMEQNPIIGFARDDKHAEQHFIISQLNGRGLSFKQEGELDSAEFYYRMALAQSEKLYKIDTNDVTNLGKSHNNLGALYRLKRNYTKALEHYNASIKYYEQAGVWALQDLALTYNNTARIYEFQKEYNKAGEYFRLSFDIQKKELIETGNVTYPTSFPTLFSSYRWFFVANKDVNQAEKIFNEGIDMYESLKRPQVFDSYILELKTYLYEIYLAANKPDRAELQLKDISVFVKSNILSNPNHYSPIIVKTAHNLTSYFIEEAENGDFENAEKFVLKMKNVLNDNNPQKQKDIKIAYGQIIQLLTTIYDKKNDRVKLRAEYRELIDLSYELAQKDPENFESFAVSALTQLGVEYGNYQDYSMAIKTLEECLKLNKKMAKNDPTSLTNMVMTCNNIGLMYYYQKEYKDAEKSLKEGLDTGLKFAEYLNKNSEKVDDKESLEMNNSVEMSKIYNTLGNIYDDTKRWAEAEPMYLKAIEIKTKYYNSDPPTFKFKLLLSYYDMTVYYENYLKGTPKKVEIADKGLKAVKKAQELLIGQEHISTFKNYPVRLAKAKAFFETAK